MVQDEWVLDWVKATGVACQQLLDRIGVQTVNVDPLPHRWRKTPIHVSLEANDLTSPMSVARAIGSPMKSQKVYQHQVEIALDHMQFGETYTFYFLSDVRPINTIHTPFPPKSAKQTGLMLRPGQDVMFVEIIRHTAIVHPSNSQSVTPNPPKLAARHRCGLPTR
jgi:hypothetical protein